MKNRKLLLIVSLVLALTMSLGGTLAYLTDTDADVNTMVLGKVEIVQNEQMRDETGKLVEYKDKPALPAVYGTSEPTMDPNTVTIGENEYNFYHGDIKNVIDKIVTVTNKGNTDAYVRTIIAIEAPDADIENNIPAFDFSLVHTNRNEDGIEWTEWAPVDVDGVRYMYSIATYAEALGKEETSAPSLMQVLLDKRTDNKDIAMLGEEWVIIALSQAVQADGFDSAEQALEEAFNIDELSTWLANADKNIGSPDENYPNSGKNDTNNPPTFSDTWDGTADTSWYNETDSEFLIMTAEQLAGFSELVDAGNTFEGKTVKLGKNIDLHFVPDGTTEPKSFNPIGYGYDVVFKGTFDGQGYTISNLYQNGWALGLSYSTAGGGLFASAVDADFKNLTIDNAEVVMECIDMGVLVGYSYGNCTYEDITVSNSLIANYQRYTGGVVGEVNGTHSFKNVDVKDTVISSLWGDFDCSLGGIIGGKWGNATVTMEDCDVACEINAYNDVTSSYQWHAYRRAGMLIGNSEETQNVDGRTSAAAPYLTATNCTVTYGDWVDYTYCEFAGTSWPYVRVQEGYSNSAYSNPRYGHPTDANGNEVVDDNHVHNEGEDHFIERTFDQLYGGGQGVYGTAAHDGVTVVYNNK